MAVTTNTLLPLMAAGSLGKEAIYNDALAMLDDLVAGYLAIDAAGSAHITLTEAQARHALLHFYGLLTGSINVIVPTRQRSLLVINGTTGAFTLTVKPVAGTGIAVEQGFGALLYCDGTNVWSSSLTGNLGNGDRGDVTVSGSGLVWTIDAAAVTYAKMQNVSAAARLLGRGDSGAGSPQELTLGSGLTLTGTTLGLLRVVEANTAGSGAPNVLTADESGTILTNEGATALNYHTLPAAAAGLVFTFVSQDADLLRVTAVAGDTIRVAAGVTATGGYIENGAQGDVITLAAINATEWVDIASRGTWTPT